jgi:hypothetical protein
VIAIVGAGSSPLAALHHDFVAMALLAAACGVAALVLMGPRVPASAATISPTGAVLSRRAERGGRAAS